MNDRFKFRVWDDIRREMINIEEQDSSPYNVSLRPQNHVMQCTGLKDCNGKLIYEGDIVKDAEDKLDTIYKIGFKKGAFFLENDDVIAYFHELRKCFAESRLEVIGNIYTTPKLLEEK